MTQPPLGNSFGSVGVGGLWSIVEANRHAEIAALLTEIRDLLKKRQPKRKRK